MNSEASKKLCRENCKLYHEEYDDRGCQVSKLLRRCQQYVKWERNVCIDALESHHIYGRGRHESYSHFCNLILISKAAHSFAHDAPVREFNARHASEVCFLTAKYCLHVTQPHLRAAFPANQQHWDVAIYDKICGFSKFRYRIDSLHESMRNSPFESLASELLDIVDR